MSIEKQPRKQSATLYRHAQRQREARPRYPIILGIGRRAGQLDQGLMPACAISTVIGKYWKQTLKISTNVLTYVSRPKRRTSKMEQSISIAYTDFRLLNRLRNRAPRALAPTRLSNCLAPKPDPMHSALHPLHTQRCPNTAISVARLYNV
jgi:hypothetical protein